MTKTRQVYRANAPFPFEALGEASKDSHRFDIVFDWLLAGDVIKLTEHVEYADGIPILRHYRSPEEPVENTDG